MQNDQILLPKNPRVLIVEDHQLMRKAQCMVVQELDKQAVIHTPSSIEEVNTLLDTQKYDVILLDNNLSYYPNRPTCKGIDLIPVIRKKCPQAIIIFTSLDNGVGDMLLEQGKVDFSASKETLVERLRA